MTGGHWSRSLNVLLGGNDIVQQMYKRRGIQINHDNCGQLMPRIENIHDEFETNQSWSNLIQFSTPINHTLASMKSVGNYSSRTEIIEKENSKKYAQKEL